MTPSQPAPSPTFIPPGQALPSAEECQSRAASIGNNGLLLQLSSCQGGPTAACCQQVSPQLGCSAAHSALNMQLATQDLVAHQDVQPVSDTVYTYTVRMCMASVAEGHSTPGSKV